MGTLTVVVVSGPRIDIGVQADCVAKILAGDDWAGPEPLALPLGAWTDQAEGPHRILVIRSGDRLVPLRARGRIFLRSIDRTLVQPLPHRALCGPRAGGLSAVVLSEGQQPLYLLDLAGHLAALTGGPG